MKVQIRSFIKGGNHGQYLQALGLKVALEQILPEAEISHLDYENHYWKELRIQARTLSLPKFIAMRHFWKKNIKFTPFEAVPDVTVYGSDMIWHLDSNLFPIDRVYFGDRDFAPHRFSYAASAGYRVATEPEWIKGMLNRFSSIGVRDRQTEALIVDHTHHTPRLVIDPCFFLANSPYSKWFEGQERRSRISFYSPGAKRLLETFYENLELSRLPEYVRNAEFLGFVPRSRFFQEVSKQVRDPLWTLRAIARSRLLITSTFHGVMMALMTKTPFIAISNPSLDARLDSPIQRAFSSVRLMSKEGLRRVDRQLLVSLLQDADLDGKFLATYVSESKAWLAESVELSGPS